MERGNKDGEELLSFVSCAASSPFGCKVYSVVKKDTCNNRKRIIESEYIKYIPYDIPRNREFGPSPRNARDLVSVALLFF
jgi:hypothetical protein